jgi:hypothetical protein
MGELYLLPFVSVIGAEEPLLMVVSVLVTWLRLCEFPGGQEGIWGLAYTTGTDLVGSPLWAPGAGNAIVEMNDETRRLTSGSRSPAHKPSEYDQIACCCSMFRFLGS